MVGGLKTKSVPMYSLKSIEHSLLTEDDLRLIIKIKSKAWNYSFEQQRSWIMNHISDNDIHLILYRENDPVAYMNLVNVNAEINQASVLCWGIGNVCSIAPGRGYGKELMISGNKYIEESGKPGLLFCKENLVPFYSRYGWQILSKSTLDLNFDNATVNVMVYNYNDCIDKLIYNNKNF